MSRMTAPALRARFLNFLKFSSDVSCARLMKYRRQGARTAKAIRYHVRNGVNDKLRSSYTMGRLTVININMAAKFKEVCLPYFTAKVRIFAIESAS